VLWRDDGPHRIAYCFPDACPHRDTDHYAYGNSHHQPNSGTKFFTYACTDCGANHHSVCRPIGSPNISSYSHA
jgi:hypothetical protein